MAHPRVLARDDSVLLIVDVQEGYRGRTVDHERMVLAVRRLLDAAQVVAVPVLITEQYPKGLGPTQPEVAEGLPAGSRPIEKLSMSCCGQPEFIALLHATARSQIVVCGIEAHACVNKT
ncbi:MAG: isochorismatase family protein, partial [Mycobacteriales bacterium]